MKIITVENGELYVMPDTVLLRNNDPYFAPDLGSGEVVVAGVCVRITRVTKCLAPRFANRAWSEYTRALDHRLLGVHHTLARCYDRSLEVCVEWTDKSHSSIDQNTVDSAVALASQHLQLRIGDYIFLPDSEF